MKRFCNWVVLLICLLCLTSCTPQRKYTRALEWIEQGKYAKAVAQLQKVNDYEESLQLITYCNAIIAGEIGEYESCLQQLEALGAFRDSLQLYTFFEACQQQAYADSIYATNTEQSCSIYLKAANAFDNVMQLRDSAARADACRKVVYSFGINCAEEQEYQKAIRILALLGEYMDAGELSTYYSACEAESLGEYSKAAALFDSLGSYSDALERAEMVRNKAYETAIHYFEEAQYDKGYALLIELDNYKNARSRAYEEMYHQGNLQIESGDYGRALAYYRKAVGYEDAEEKIRDLTNAANNVFILNGNAAAAIKADGTVVVSDNTYYNQESVSEWTQIASLYTSGSHIVGLRQDGTVVAAGRNDDHECEVDQWTNIIDVAVQPGCTIGLKADGSVCVTLSELQDVLADWTNIQMIKAGAFQVYGLRRDSTVVATGLNTNGQCNVEKWTDIVDIAVSSSGQFAIGLRKDGTILTTIPNANIQYEISNWNNLIAISAGANHFVGLKADGSVVASGSNQLGQCEVSSWTDIIGIATGTTHTVGLKRDGTVLAVGINKSKQCDVEEWSDIVSIKATVGTCGLKSDGTVIWTGPASPLDNNTEMWSNIVPTLERAFTSQQRLQQLYKSAEALLDMHDYSKAWTAFAAIGEYQDASTLAKTCAYQVAETMLANGNPNSALLYYCRAEDYLDSSEKAANIRPLLKGMIAVGDGFSLGINEDGSLFTAGRIPDGWFGEKWHNLLWVSAYGFTAVGLKADKTVVSEGLPHDLQKRVDNWSDIIAIDLSSKYIVGLLEDGTVVAAGPERAIQDSLAQWSDIVAISVSNEHIVGLKSNGTVVATGTSENGQCDISDWEDIVDISAGHLCTIGLRSDGTVVAAGLNMGFQCEVTEWTDVVAVDSMGGVTFGIKADNTYISTAPIYWLLIAAGDYTLLPQENGSYQYQFSQQSEDHLFDNWIDVVAITMSNTNILGLKADGTVLAVGANNLGQANTENWTGIMPSAKKSTRSIKHQRMLYHAACALQQAGAYAEAQEIFVRLGSYLDANDRANECSYRHAQAMLQSRQYGEALVYYVQANGYADSRANIQMLRPMFDGIIAAGDNHVVGLLENGSVVAAGSNENGQCDVSDWTNIVFIAAAGDHTVGLKADHTVVSTGLPENERQIISGWKDIVAIDTSNAFTVGIKKDGSVVSAGARSSGDTYQQELSLWQDIIRISVSDNHIVGLRSDGTVVAEGYRVQGQCLVDGWCNIVDVSASKNFTVGIKSDGTAVVTGFIDDPDWEISDFDGLADLEAENGLLLGAAKHQGVVTAGNIDHYYLKAGYKYETFLDAKYNTISRIRLADQREMFSDWEKLVSVKIGQNHLIGLKSDGTVVVAGSNEYGQCDLADWPRLMPSIYRTIVPEQLRQTIYEEAAALLVNGEYDTAAAAFSSLEEYLDAEDRAKECWYAYGEQLLSENTPDYDKAAYAFREADDYACASGEAANRARECLYLKGNALMTAGKTAEALLAYGNSEGYADSSAKIFEALNVHRDLIATGATHSVALKPDGTVVAFGDNSAGQCNVEHWTDIIAISAAQKLTIGLKADGMVVTTDDEMNLENWHGVVAISAGSRMYDQSVIGLKADGTLYSAENPALVAGISDVARCVSRGPESCVVLHTDGKARVYEQDYRTKDISIVAEWENVIDISANEKLVAVLKSDGKVDFYDEDENEYQLQDWSNIMAISAGRRYIAGLKTDGTVVVSERGIQKAQEWSNIVAISADDSFIIGLRADGTIIAAGNNMYDRCDIDGLSGIELAVQIPVTLSQRKENLYQLASQKQADGDYIGAGRLFQSLGDERDSAVRGQECWYLAAEKMLVSEEAANKLHAYTRAGDYLDAHEKARDLRKQITGSLASGEEFIVGLTSKGTVVTYGSNAFQQSSVEHWQNVVAITAGDQHTVGLRKNGSAVAAGSNEYGQCNVSGWKNIVAIDAASEYTIGLKSDGTAVLTECFLQNMHSTAKNWTDLISVSAGNNHTVALKADGTAVALGWNDYGECDVESWTDLVAIAAGPHHTVGLKADGTVVATGFNASLQCEVQEWKNIVAIVAQDNYTLGLTAEGKLVGTFKRTVNENSTSTSGWTKDTDHFADLVAIESGSTYVVALRSNGAVVCWDWRGEYIMEDWPPVGINVVGLDME